MVRDSVHGNIKLEGIFLELMESPEFQRLHGIKQLGFTNLVYPGANHTRLEHSLGVCHIAKKMADSLNLPIDEKELVAVAALLHDIGHGPFSHTLEYLMHQRRGIDHVGMAEKMINGEISLGFGESVRKILEKYGLNSGEIIELISGKGKNKNKKSKKYLREMIHGAIDADQLDYLLRDAHYTGVAYGVIDLDRFIQTLIIRDGLAVESKGISAVESFLVARALMYSSVYLHKTVRIAELMLARAVERSPNFDFSLMDDCQLMEKLEKMGGLQEEMAMRLKYRKLFKKAYSKRISNLSMEQRVSLAEMKLDERKDKEDELARKCGMKEGEVIIDIPGRELFISEPRIKETDVKILDDGNLKPLSNFTPLANALQMRGVIDWAIMVCTIERKREKVAKEAEKVIF